MQKLTEETKDLKMMSEHHYISSHSDKATLQKDKTIQSSPTTLKHRN